MDADQKRFKMVTFQVIEGVDKGRIFRDLSIPVTIGREEGNLLRLNDERVSRYHAKVQQEDEDIILTDLDSTNGTRVNGMPIQIRRLRPGDQIELGRSRLLFGSLEEIAAQRRVSSQVGHPVLNDSKTVAGGTEADDDLDFSLDMDEDLPSSPSRRWGMSETERPPLPMKLSAAQAARLSEIFDYLHQGVAQAMENLEGNDEGNEIRIAYNEWQILQAVQLFLAKYVRDIGDPNPLD